MEKILNYINGEIREPSSKKYIENFNPSNGEVYSLIAKSNKKDIDSAVDSANSAFNDWSVSSKKFRHDVLMSIADKIEENFEALVVAESLDNGKTESLARRVDIPRASENFRFFATAILHFSSETHDMDGKALNYTLREPVVPLSKRS